MFSNRRIRLQRRTVQPSSILFWPTSTSGSTELQVSAQALTPSPAVPVKLCSDVVIIICEKGLVSEITRKCLCSSWGFQKSR